VDRADIELIRFGGWIMHRRIVIAGSIAALVGVAAIGWSALALAQTRLTTATNPITGSGTWTRTIIDVEPNGPDGGAIQSTYVISVPFTGLTAQQLADAYKAQAALVLPQPVNNPNGFGTVADNRVNPTIRVGRQTGTFSFSDGNLPGGVTTYVPSNSEHAPLASPAGLAAMATSLSALAWWARRRRMSV